jgi:hypothetical protein
VTIRAALALLLAALVASLGALMLGEYEFTGSLPFLVGPLFGLAIGEIVATVGRSKAVLVGLVAAALCFGAIYWAGYIDSGDGLEPIHPFVWPSAAICAGFAYLRIAGLPGRTKPGR